MLNHHNPKSVDLVNVGIFAEPQRIVLDDLDIVLVGSRGRRVYRRRLGLER
jgi:hypothetical protein